MNFSRIANALRASVTLLVLGIWCAMWWTAPTPEGMEWLLWPPIAIGMLTAALVAVIAVDDWNRP